MSVNIKLIRRINFLVRVIVTLLTCSLKQEKRKFSFLINQRNIILKRVLENNFELKFTVTDTAPLLLVGHSLHHRHESPEKANKPSCG